MSIFLAAGYFNNVKGAAHDKIDTSANKNAKKLTPLQEIEQNRARSIANSESKYRFLNNNTIDRVDKLTLPNTIFPVHQVDTGHDTVQNGLTTLFGGNVSSENSLSATSLFNRNVLSNVPPMPVLQVSHPGELTQVDWILDIEKKVASTKTHKLVPAL
jgi:hypothetical protein